MTEPEAPKPPSEPPKSGSLWPARARKKSVRTQAIEAAEAELENAIHKLVAAKEENDATYKDFFEAHEVQK